MNILHICNDFSYSKVHTNLYENLDSIGIQQIIYHPLRSTDNKGKNVFEFNVNDSEVVYSSILKRYHRLFFKKKIDFLYDDIINKVDLDKIDCQYATTLFSDGALAYKIYKTHNIPYIVALRSTDVDLFLKLRPDLYSLGKCILLNSKKIIIISPAIKYNFLRNNYFSKLEIDIKSKIELIPNGVDIYWLKNLNLYTSKSQNSFIFIGEFSIRKNVLRLIHSLEQCRLNTPEISLHLVGGGGNRHDEVIDLIKDKPWIKYHGKVFDKERLKDIFSQCDFFAMPSIHETFGLVYIEALTQGLPILYTKGQGVDGIFDKKIGIATNPKNTYKISNDINWIIDNRLLLANNIKKINFTQFDWYNIAKKYKEIFEDIIK